MRWCNLSRLTSPNGQKDSSSSRIYRDCGGIQLCRSMGHLVYGPTSCTVHPTKIVISKIIKIKLQHHQYVEYRSRTYRSEASG